MSAKRFGRLHKATALVPLALLSAAWTASLAGVERARRRPPASAPTRRSPTAPASRPRRSRRPASVSDGSLLAPGVGGADAAQIVSTASTSGIPSAALAAYQRAETVINAADKSCHLTWQLIAAIGRVESNHGRANGNILDDNGLATPGIYGIALNGANSTTEIVDTDAGQYDNDAQYDRAVGPMQFIPSTWSVVGVDADGDGVRNPQDIDDAALGTAVYLCSGADDLGHRRRAARRGLPLQPQPVLRRPGARDHGRLPRPATSPPIPNGTVIGRPDHQDPAAAARARGTPAARRRDATRRPGHDTQSQHPADRPGGGTTTTDRRLAARRSGGGSDRRRRRQPAVAAPASGTGGGGGVSVPGTAGHDPAAAHHVESRRSTRVLTLGPRRRRQCLLDGTQPAAGRSAVPAVRRPAT